MVLITINLKRGFLSLFDPILSWSFFSSILQNIDTRQPRVFFALSQFRIFFWFLFNDLILSGIPILLYILLRQTTGSALLGIFGSDLIGNFLVTEVVLHAHSYADGVSHGDIAQLVGQVVAAVYAHHLLAFLGSVWFYFLETFIRFLYASSQKRMPFITL